ncbi:hypothetical protein C5167_025180 [Papaver somniferum]|uniref:3-hydroxyisobutyryl-CoA hydrolase n=1 Tax=Papaver somniferum TaxID=3469 RepID=A0A4Y7JTP4_PAPSO|nr:hypothetical protein C5167_025180 [Papaver somniferum]
MAQEAIPITEEVVVLRGDVNTHVRLITLNRPRQLNVISPKVVSLLAESLKKWEKDDNVELVIFKGNGRAYSAGGDLKVFYDGRDSYDACREVVDRMYWLCYHNHTYMKTQIFSMPEASEYLALTGARLNGKELVSVGLATHYVPSEATIDKCFSKESVEEIFESLESEANNEENEWIPAVLKGLKRSAPTGLKITLRSVREGREQTLPECLKKEFRLTINILRKLISGDLYEWNPASLEEVTSEKLDLVFQPLKEDLELFIPTAAESRDSTKEPQSDAFGPVIS